MKKIKILFTGSGAPGWVPLYKCLIASKQQFEIYGCDMQQTTAGVFYAKKHFIVPAGNDSKYIDTILKLVTQEKIDIILPLTDSELIPLARNRDVFHQHNILIPISSVESLEISMDKSKLFEFLKKEKFGSCKFVFVKSWKEFTESTKKLGFPKNPICLKPAVAWGSRGFRIIDPAIDQYEIFMHQKPTSTYATFEQIEQLLKPQKNFPEMLVMEYLPGKEYTVDIFMQNRKAEYIIPRLRIGMKNGITTEGIVENNREIISLSRKIAETLQLNYSVGIQFKYDKNNKPKVLEINPRLQGTSVISYAAGINLPYFNILALLGEKIPKKKILYGTHMFRHWNEVFFYKNKSLTVFAK